MTLTNNNHVEQQMRKSVLTSKVPQQNRSDNGAKTQAILITLIRLVATRQKSCGDHFSIVKFVAAGHVLQEIDLKLEG